MVRHHSHVCVNLGSEKGRPGHVIVLLCVGVGCRESGNHEGLMAVTVGITHGKYRKGDEAS